MLGRSTLTVEECSHGADIQWPSNRNEGSVYISRYTPIFLIPWTTVGVVNGRMYGCMRVYALCKHKSPLVEHVLVEELMV